MPTLLDALQNSSRPVFLFGSTPPRDGTSIEKAKETCAKVRNEVCFSQYFIAVFQVLTVFCMVSSFKFATRSATLATDGFIVYDIQDEGGRTTTERPFPFRFVDNAFQYY